MSFLGHAPPSGFRLLLVVIPPGGERRCDTDEWREALVVIERGSVELRTVGAGRLALPRGSVLSIDRLRRSRMHNRGGTAAILAVVTRAPSP